MTEVRNISLLDTVKSLGHIDSIIPSLKGMLSAEMLSLRKKKNEMGVLINRSHRELYYPMEMLMEPSRLLMMDNWFHMYLHLLEGQYQTLAHLISGRPELMSMVSHRFLVDNEQIQK